MLLALKDYKRRADETALEPSRSGGKWIRMRMPPNSVSGPSRPRSQSAQNVIGKGTNAGRVSFATFSYSRL